MTAAGTGERLREAFAQLAQRGGKGIVPFLCAGQPDLPTTTRLLGAVDSPSVPVVEIGIPFSDPIADGPVIAAAMHEALQRGVTPSGAFASVRDARDSGALKGTAVFAMVSVSVVSAIGPEAFVAEAREAGVDGFIFPDAPIEEADRVVGPVLDAGLDVSLLVAPSTPPARMELIAGRCTGFVYLLARAGITGSQGGGPGREIGGRVAALRGMTDLPIACGFGIASPEHVRQVVHEAGADCAIVGSAIVRCIGEAGGQGTDVVERTGRFVRELERGLIA